jgi:hypothetical protein
MEKPMSSKDIAKQVHKRFKACGYDNKLYCNKFCPDKTNLKEYHKFVDSINLYNKFYGYIVRIELL